MTAYGIAKLLKVDARTVHLRLYSDMWPERPSTVDPWALRLEPSWSDSPGIAHMPLSLTVYFSMEPNFVRLAMVGTTELDGYRAWKASGGRKFGVRDIRA